MSEKKDRFPWDESGRLAAEIREELGLTQKQLAQVMTLLHPSFADPDFAIDPAVVSQIERGDRDRPYPDYRRVMIEGFRLIARRDASLLAKGKENYLTFLAPIYKRPAPGKTLLEKIDRLEQMWFPGPAQEGEKAPPSSYSEGTLGGRASRPAARGKSLEDIGRDLAEYFDSEVKIRRWPILLLVAAPFVSLCLWNVVCHSLEWPYYMGESRNQEARLVGWHAFWWGVITVFPVVVSSRLVDVNLAKLIRGIVRAPGVVGLLKCLWFSACGGLGAFVFYTFLQKGLETSGLAAVPREIAKATMWCLFVTLGTVGPMQMLPWPVQLNRVLTVLTQLLLVAFFTVPPIAFFVAIVPDKSAFTEARGLLAHLAFTGGLACALVIGQRRCPEALKELETVRPES